VTGGDAGRVVLVAFGADAVWFLLGISATRLAAVTRSTPVAPKGSRGFARGVEGGAGAKHAREAEGGGQNGCSPVGLTPAGMIS
jgi:hypothetical protein